MADSSIMDNDAEVSILLLGDSGVGKSTFLTRLRTGMKSSLPSQNLHDLDQPFPFNIRLHGRSLRLEFYDTASPTNYTLLKPDILVLCYSIANLDSLSSLSTHWKTVVETYFNYHGAIPIIVLGLQRDVRSKEDYDGRVRQIGAGNDGDDDDGTGPLNGRTFSYPQEGLLVAQSMRCDRYCECSALTGELCHEVFEDIAKTATLTLTEQGGRSKGPWCVLM